MQKKIQSAPTMIYPESDGKPMAETDVHRKLMMDFMSLCDGNNSVLKIANQLNVPAWDLYDQIDKLKSYNLIVTES